MKFGKIDGDAVQTGVLYKGEWHEVHVAGELLLASESVPRRFKTLTVHIVSDRYLLTLTSGADESICYSTSEAIEVIESDVSSFFVF